MPMISSFAIAIGVYVEFAKWIVDTLFIYHAVYERNLLTKNSIVKGLVGRDSNSQVMPVYVVMQSVSSN